MTIGTLSIDPRRVLTANVNKDRGAWILTISYQVGTSMLDLEDEYDDKEDAMAALVKLDAACYKGPLADAIGTDRLEEDNEENELARMGLV
jgi:hypothetical protein